MPRREISYSAWRGDDSFASEYSSDSEPSIFIAVLDDEKFGNFLLRFNDVVEIFEVTIFFVCRVVIIATGMILLVVILGILCVSVSILQRSVEWQSETEVDAVANISPLTSMIMTVRDSGFPKLTTLRSCRQSTYFLQVPFTTETAGK